MSVPSTHATSQCATVQAAEQKRTILILVDVVAQNYEARAPEPCTRKARPAKWLHFTDGARNPQWKTTDDPRFRSHDLELFCRSCCVKFYEANNAGA
jgi:hypothetical protein